jgi:hypothetical protein
MREQARLEQIDGEYYFVLRDGTIIENDKIGWVVNSYGGFPEETFYERFTQDTADFIFKNDIECEIEMMDEFSNPEEFESVGLFDSSPIPKLYKGKILIHLL